MDLGPVGTPLTPQGGSNRVQEKELLDAGHDWRSMDLTEFSIFGKETIYAGVVGRLVREVTPLTMLGPDFYPAVVAAAIELSDYGRLGRHLLTANPVVLSERPHWLDRSPLPDGVVPSQLEEMVATAVVAGCRAWLEHRPAHLDHEFVLTDGGFLYTGQTAVPCSIGLDRADLYGHRVTANAAVVTDAGIEELPEGHPHWTPAHQRASDIRDWKLKRWATIRRA
jgi:hypothetical protein